MHLMIQNKNSVHIEMKDYYADYAILLWLGGYHYRILSTIFLINKIDRII